MAEPYMEYIVPEPVIEMPKLREDTAVDTIDNVIEDKISDDKQFNVEAYSKYLDYLHFLVVKYGEDWKKELSDEETRRFLLSYYDSHPDASEEEILQKFR